MTKLRTTTWKGRNYERLQRVKEEATKLGMYNPTVIDVGPGGLINFLFDHFPDGKRKNWTAEERLNWVTLRILETLLRKTNLFDLESSEPYEIADIFKDLHPEKIYVVDSEPKVIEAVRKLVKSNGLDTPFEYALVDITAQQIPQKGDIVIAYRVAQRTPYPQKSLETIAESVKNDGLLSLNEDFEIPGFRRVDRGLYVNERADYKPPSRMVLHHDTESLVTLERDGLVKKSVYKSKGSGLRFGISAEKVVEREIKALELLANMEGIQKFVGRRSGTSFTSHFVEGPSLRTYGGKLPQRYFDELLDIIRQCEERGVYRLGQNRVDFLITSGTKPAIIDFGNILFRDESLAQVPLVLLLAKIYSRLRVYDLKRRYSM